MNQTQSEAAPVEFALVLDGQGGAHLLDNGAWQNWQPGQGFLWLHLRSGNGAARDLLTERFKLDPARWDAFADDASHSRCIRLDTGVLLNFRGLTANPTSHGGTQPLSLWLEADHAISLGADEPLALLEMRRRLETGQGPATAADLPACLMQLLYETYRVRLQGLTDLAERLQDRIYEDLSKDFQTRLSLVRRHASRLNQLLDDQHRLMEDLQGLSLPWLSHQASPGLRVPRDQLHQLLGNMRSLREHLHGLQDELNGLLDHRVNERLYLLTVVNGVCFPLVFITGLLGVNVGGIPGANQPDAFWILCGLLVVLGGLVGWLLRRWHWL